MLFEVIQVVELWTTTKTRQHNKQRIQKHPHDAHTHTHTHPARNASVEYVWV